MRRVVITGLGILSSIGNNKQEVSESLKAGRSGIEFCQQFADYGLKSQIAGTINLDLEDHVNRKLKRFMSDGIAFNYLAMKEAIEDSQLNQDEVSSFRT